MENFQLKKVKLGDDLGVDVTYHEKTMNEGSTYWIENTKRNMIPRHNDMDVVAEKLRIHVARIFGLLALGLYKDEKDMSEREKQLLETIIDDIKIIGLTISGDEDKQGVAISAKKKVFGNKVIILNTPNMLFSDEKYDFCYELGEIIKDFTKEVWEYLFKRKYAQLELAFEEVEGEQTKGTKEAIEGQIAEFRDKKAEDGKITKKVVVKKGGSK